VEFGDNNMYELDDLAETHLLTVQGQENEIHVVAARRQFVPGSSDERAGLGSNPLTASLDRSVMPSTTS